MDKLQNLFLDKLPLSIRDDQTSLIALGISILVLILTLFYYAFISSGRKGKHVCILGLSDSGKTVLFAQIVGGRNVATLTSMKENECSVKLAKKSVSLVDIPGYERLRNKYWEDIRNHAKGIIFVIDSYQIITNFRDVADYLYSILTDKVVQKKKLPILIACNKQDKPKSKSSKIVRSILEKELTAIRETRLAALESTDGREESSQILGFLDREFSFGDVRNKLEFVDCTAYSKEDIPAQIEEVIDWLNKA